jgi:hypothetical protein
MNEGAVDLTPRPPNSTEAGPRPAAAAIYRPANSYVTRNPSVRGRLTVVARIHWL